MPSPGPEASAGGITKLPGGGDESRIIESYKLKFAMATFALQLDVFEAGLKILYAQTQKRYRGHPEKSLM
jgi:hypothetical protein